MIFEALFGDDGSSEVLGYVLIFGIVISAIGVVVAFGLPTINDAKDNADYQNSLNSIRNIRNELDRISDGPIRGGGLVYEGDLVLENGFLEFIPNSTQVNVYIDGSLVFSEEIGVMRYEFRDRVIGVESSGLFYKISDSGSSSVLESPKFFAEKSGSENFVRMHVVDFEGEETGFSGNRRMIFRNENFSVLHQENVSRDPVIDNLTIEISGNFTGAWSYFFEKELEEEEIDYSVSEGDDSLRLVISDDGEEDIYLGLYESDIGYDIR